MPFLWPAVMGPKSVAAVLALAVCGHLLLASAAPALDLDIDGQAIFDQLMQLATFTDDPNPAVTRVVFTGPEGRVGQGPPPVLPGRQDRVPPRPASAPHAWE